ncbi:Carboxylic ester hydrolase [Pandoravirus macleodensis]|uniref:Carboxylic ester hydrolase n=1 Tax=Pandoravirus macleodensis TaxID=2107707 RepID=A0A2U7UFD0_9VIRU|nr:Carboxylic ester hydrolase [Pandoravirus macleodensis]AVK77075.1 Carboxylic ester hydrolase [Pandoravirus macleodensis]UMO79772.1 Carboxylic ester hydrolase [Pandoravirus aubagnensis]
MDDKQGKVRSLVVLALHGYGQTNDDLARPLKRLLKAPVGHPPATVIYAVAPVALDPPPGRAWWRRPTMGLNDTFVYQEFDQTLNAVREALAGHHVDAVVGFSQGAVLATLLLQSNALPGCERVVLFGASGVQDPGLSRLAPVDRRVRALFGHGTRDTLCAKEDVDRLAAAYAAPPARLTHRWGHVVPSDAASRNAVVSFLWGTDKTTDDDNGNCPENL